MKKRFLSLLSIMIILSLFLAGTVSATGKDTSAPALVPGQTVTYTQTIPINIVFIGYQPSDINKADFASWLPSTYKPLVRYPEFYGISGRDMGLQYNFSYNYFYKGAAFSNQFFQFLRAIGKKDDLTYYQSAYNAQVNNIQDVTGPVLYIDAPTVENYLASKLAMPTKSYTIVFINWYSRPDFKYHVYTKTDEPDPDTGYNFGALRSSRKTIAWGGGASRLWFYDLSAGPESWSGNYNVDDADLDGDGVADYRMPPIWEYSANGYRAPADLSGDLGLVTRFVGIDLLFTTSPLYDPMVTAPAYGGKKVIHVNMMEDDPASLGADWINMSLVRSSYMNFQPYYGWSANLTYVNPIDAGALSAFRTWTEVNITDGCWNDAAFYFQTYAELFCYFNENRADYIPAYKPADYVAAFHAFNTTDANMGIQYGLLGFSDDNWVDGTQSYVFEFGTNGYRGMGYGFTSTTIHEGGHHFGMSHPHDGYDYGYDIDFGPSGGLYFAWSGDESSTVMHYMDLSTKFSQFDKDNMYRWETAGYLNWSNQLLGTLAAHPKYSTVRAYVLQSQKFSNMSVNNFNAWNYGTSAALARKAYMSLVQAANILGVATPDALQVQAIAPNLQAPHEGDPIRFPDN
jgi:hypothetical protein